MHKKKKGKYKLTMKTEFQLSRERDNLIFSLGKIENEKKYDKNYIL